MGKKYIASVSFGKDSLAMLFKLLYSEKYRLDEVVFYDTGMEFNAIYKIRDKIKKELSKFGIKYTELRPKETFEYMMFEKIVNHKEISWTARRWSWVDPVKDINSASIAVKNGFRSRSDVIREIGRDPDEVWNEVEEENKTLKSKGILTENEVINDVSENEEERTPAK